MPADRYTKAVLTVIAACLVYLVAKDCLGPSAAEAQARFGQGVVIVGIQRAPGAPWEPLPLGR
ncbi:MAG: hypothetical protein AB1578_19825 [Thermodesulfobacteriota bacterium]|jgi:hypothetical protein